MRKDHLHVSVDREILRQIEEIWKMEQSECLKRGERVAKSGVVQKLLILGIEAYKRRKPRP